MSNVYSANVSVQEFPATPGKFLFQRPTEASWNEFGFTIKPLAGQPIRIREAINIEFSREAITSGSMTWFNRFYTEAFVGHFQVTRVNPGDPTLVAITEKGQIIGTETTTLTYNWVFQREYDLNLFLRSDDLRPATIGVVANCNFDLAPGPVENRYIDATNVDRYVRIAYALSTGDFANASTLIDSLTLPVIAGYKVPDETLFSILNQLPGVDLTDFTFTSRLGNIGLWVHPDWEVIPTAVYTAEIINFSPLAMSPNQIPESIACRYPGALGFP